MNIFASLRLERWIVFLKKKNIILSCFYNMKYHLSRTLQISLNPWPLGELAVNQIQPNISTVPHTHRCQHRCPPVSDGQLTRMASEQRGPYERPSFTLWSSPRYGQQISQSKPRGQGFGVKPAVKGKAKTWYGFFESLNLAFVHLWVKFRARFYCLWWEFVTLVDL